MPQPGQGLCRQPQGAGARHPRRPAPLTADQILKCLDGDFYQSRLTTAPELSQLHVLPLFSLTHKAPATRRPHRSHLAQKLQEHLSNHRRYTACVAFRPTGWTFGGSDAPPRAVAGVTIHGRAVLLRCRTSPDGRYTVLGAQQLQ